MLAVAAVLHRCPALTSLDLCGNAALNAGARAVAAAVTHPGCGLRSVAMTFNMTAREWSASGLEDCIRLLHSALPHSRLTSLRLDFRYEVISRTRPLRYARRAQFAAAACDLGGLTLCLRLLTPTLSRVCNSTANLATSENAPARLHPYFF